MTTLSKPVTRETAAQYIGRNVLVTIAPAGSQREALIRDYIHHKPKIMKGVYCE